MSENLPIRRLTESEMMWLKNRTHLPLMIFLNRRKSSAML